MTAPTAALLEPPQVAPPNTVLFRGLTIDEIAAYEQRLEALTLEAMRRVMRQVTRNLGRTTTAALTAAVDPSGISPDDLAGIIPLWQTQLDEQLLPVVAEIYRDSSGALTAQMLETAANPPPVSSAAAEAYLVRARAQFSEVGGELWEQARNQLLDGMSAGESVPQIADRLRTTTPALTNRTASLIARTQVNDAANAGSFDTARVSGLDLLKGWESTADLRTRETHLMAGSTYSGPGMIGLDDPFMVGGWPCLRPHDLSLPPEERYNCRCTLIYMMRGSELTASEQAIRDLEAEHAARVAALQAQHNQQLDQLLAQHAQRVAVMEQQHVTRTAAIEARYQAKLAQIQQSSDTATEVAQAIAKAKAAHQLRLAQWDADYQLRTAKRVAEYEQRVLLRNTYYDQRRAVLDAEYQHRLAIARGQPPGPLPSGPSVPSFEARINSAASGESAMTATRVPAISDPIVAADVTQYGMNEYAAINRALEAARGAPLSSDVPYFTRRTVQSIDSVMRPAKREIVVTRGITREAAAAIFGENGPTIGSTWTGYGFTSTSSQTAAKLGEVFTGGTGGVRMRILAPRGTKALSTQRGLRGTPGTLDPDEIVLDRGLTFRVVADRGSIDGVRQIDVEVIPKGLPSAPLPTGPAVTVPVAGQPTLVPIRASLLQATTIPEVRKAFIQEWQRVVKANPGAIRGAARFAPRGDVQTAREHAEGLLRAIERFPRTRLDVTYGSMSHYAETAARRVSFATEYAHARDDYLLSLRLSGATGPDGTAYHPITISSPQGIALHEFGHALQYGLAFDQQGLYDYGLYLQVNRRVRKLVQELADERGVSADDLIRMEVGRYAQESGTQELVAEAFADVMVNGNQASALSRRIFTLLVDDYERLNPPGPGVPGVAVAPSKPFKPGRVLTQAEKDQARGVAETLTEINELRIGQASEKALTNRIQARGQLANLPQSVIDDLVAAVTGTSEQFDALIARLETRYQLRMMTGPAGTFERFDRLRHEILGGDVPDGTPVLIVRPGYRLDIGKGELVRVNRATVLRATEDDLAPDLRLPFPSKPSPVSAAEFESKTGFQPTSATKFTSMVRQAVKGDSTFRMVPVGRGYRTLEEIIAQGHGRLPAVFFRGLESLPNPQEVERALRRYIETERYRQVNAGLRREALGGRPMSAAARQDVGLIDEALNASRLDEDILVWRGPGEEVFQGLKGIPDDLTGFVWTEPGYSSTSASEGYVATTFGSYRPVLRIVVPKGSKAVQLSGGGDESEILLSRGLTFRVVKDHGIKEIPGYQSVDFPTGIKIRLLDVEIVPLGSQEITPIGRGFAEALQLAETGADTQTIVERLGLRWLQAPQEATGPAATLWKQAIQVARSAKSPEDLIRKLRDFAVRKGFVLPNPGQLKAIAAAEKKAAAAAAKAEKARLAEIKRQVKAVEQGDFSSLVRVGPQAGGNPGGVFEDASGTRWYVKQYRNEEQARSETLALAFYRAAGLDAPDMVIGSGAPDIAGKGVQVATRLLPDAKTDLLDRLANDPAYIAKVREGFALDAWLANWDVVGLDAGNIVSSGGVPWRIDAGGVLRWRALGEPKGSAFGDNVVEWLTLRDPTRAAQASQIFQGMTRQQLLDAVARVKKLTPARIQSLVSRYGLDAKLAARLIARRADLLEQAVRELDLVGNYKLMLRTAKRGKPALNEAPVRLEYPKSKVVGISDPTGEIGDALGSYRELGYTSVNDGLRRGAHPGQRVIDQIGYIDRALDQSPLRSDVVVFRGFQTGRSVFGDRSQWGNLAGFEWRETGYASTAVNRVTATPFTETYNYGLGQRTAGVLMRIIAPKGTNAIQLSGMNYEGELMLDRGLLFRVVKDYGDDKYGVRILDVEVISRITPRTPVT